MKSKVVSLIKDFESDNIKISYSDIKVSGFPFVWEVKILDPKISLTDQLKTSEFLSKYLSVIFNYKLTEMRINFDKSVSFHDSRDTDTQVYVLSSIGESPLVGLKFEKLIFLLNNSELSNSLKSIKINNLGFVVNREQEQVFAVSDVGLVFDKTVGEKLENINIKIAGEYKSETSFFKFQNANLSLDIDYITNLEIIGEQEANVSFERLVNITEGDFAFDKATLGLKGSIQLSRNKLPEGELAVSITGYPELMDAIIPEDFIVSGQYMKRLISRAVSVEPREEPEGDAKFKIKFGSEGASIGNINLMHLGE